MDCSLPGSSVHGSLWARILERVASPVPLLPSTPRTRPESLVSPASADGFFTTSASQEGPISSTQARSHFSRVRLRATLCTVACQAPLAMGFSRQECWSGLPSPPPGDLPYPWIKPCLVSPAMAGKLLTTAITGDILPQNVTPSKHDKLGPAYPQPSNSSPEEAELQSYLQIITLLSL